MKMRRKVGLAAMCSAAIAMVFAVQHGQVAAVVPLLVLGAFAVEFAGLLGPGLSACGADYRRWCWRKRVGQMLVLTGAAIGAPGATMLRLFVITDAGTWLAGTAMALGVVVVAYSERRLAALRAEAGLPSPRWGGFDAELAGVRMMRAQA